MRALAGRLAAWAAAAATGMAATGAAAQEYPARPVRLVVPFVAGGGTDLVGRTIAQRLTDAWGQTVVVDNRPGAGGVIGADIVAKAVPDGYTLLMGTPGALTINPVLQAKMPYDPLRDFAPASLATISPFVLVVHPGVPAQNVKELVALAKAKPRSLNYGSAGNGSVAHLSTELFKSLAGIDLVHIPYKGSAQSITDLLGGQIQVVFDNLPVVVGHIRSARVRALGVGTKKRSSLLPDVPAIAEAGVPGYEASTGFGVLAPARVPAAVLAKVSADVARVLATAEVRERLATQGLEAVGSTPEQYRQYIREELEKNARIVREAKIKAE